MKPGSNRDSIATKVAALGHRWVEPLRNRPGKAVRILLGLLLWLSFIKLPSSTTLDKGPPSWEAVLSFAVAHHLQWGQDIIFTYGPLGFLTSDYYWGNFFWPVLLWSFGFSLLLTVLLVRLLERVILPVRIALYVGLPLLTVPHCADLGIDPIYLFAITIVGITCFPEERPGVAWLVISSSLLGVLSLIKFTFCLYGLFALLTLAAAHLIRRRPGPIGILLGSSLASFIAAWWFAGQHMANIGPWFQHSAQVASGYSSAMSIAPPNSDVVLGILIWLCLTGLLLVHWHGSREPLAQTPRICLITAGIFLAWKEGFVRADNVHVVVFLLYAFLMAATMPALLRMSGERRSLSLLLTAATMIFALAPFAMQDSAFVAAIRNDAVPRLGDTFTALFAPARFKHRLETQLESMCLTVRLPQIAAMVGNAPVGVLGCYQDIAILNGFNYRPHPVFQGYSAYSPELQRLNSLFFDSAEAPEYVLWRYETIDRRFPTLDDGQIVLRILNAYSPVAREGDFILWRRNALRDQGYALIRQDEIRGSLGQWMPVPAHATWLKVELDETWFGAVKRFFCRASVPGIDVRLEDGQTKSYRLLPGNALAGFVVNPLLYSEADLVLPFLKEGKPLRVTAVRVYSKKWSFDDSVRFEMEKIEGIPALRCDPGSN